MIEGLFKITHENCYRIYRFWRLHPISQERDGFQQKQSFLLLTKMNCSTMILLFLIAWLVDINQYSLDSTHLRFWQVLCFRGHSLSFSLMRNSTVASIATFTLFPGLAPSGPDITNSWNQYIVILCKYALADWTKNSVHWAISLYLVYRWIWHF